MTYPFAAENYKQTTDLLRARFFHMKVCGHLAFGGVRRSENDEFHSARGAAGAVSKF
jgi:hypothetical protein